MRKQGSRWRSCTHKRRWGTEENAQAVLSLRCARHVSWWKATIYQCKYCGGWHIGN